MKKSVKYFLAVFGFSILISLPLLIPYIHSGYFPTHDGEWAVVRLADMFREIRDLQIPPRLSGNLNFGYGYPLFNFAYPFPYYLGVLIHMLGFGFVTSVKIIFAMSIPLSAFFMFLASRIIWKNNYSGIISAVLYLYFPYHLVDLYVRGSIGESVAFALFPLILLSLSKLVENPKSLGFKILGAAAFSTLILTHNIMAVLFSITLLIFFIGNFITKRDIVKPFLFVVLLGICLSAYFWIPALFEKHNILLSQIPIADRNLYFVGVKDLLFSPWGYGIPTDRVTGFTYQIGWPSILVLITVAGKLIFEFYRKTKVNSSQILALTLIIGTILFGFLLFSLSKPLWKLPFLSEINYPWTVLSQIGLLISLLAGYLVNRKITLYIGLGIAILAIFLYLPFAKPSEYVNRGEGFYMTNDATTTSSNELMPLWVKKHPSQRPVEKVELISGEGEINNLNYSSHKFGFNANLFADSKIRINTIYYPGWKIFAGDSSLPIFYENEKGVMEISLNKGVHQVSGRFSETAIRLIADFISFFGIIFVIYLVTKTYLIKLIRK